MLDYVRGLPFPVAVGLLFVIVVLRAGATYGIGRAAHAGAERTRLRRWTASPGFTRARDLVERWGAPVVALSFLTVGFQTLVNAAAGLGRMPLRRYLPALAVGGLLWALLYASVGLIALAGLLQLWQASPAAAIGAVLAVAAAVAGYVWVQRRRTRRRDLTTVDR